MNPPSYIDYIDKMQNIQNKLLEFLENEDSQETNFHIFIHYLDHQKIRENKQEIKEFLHLLSIISNYHHHTNIFLIKIQQIIKNFEKDIKFFFTNFNIFKIFKTNKRILVFLFEEKIIIPDEIIFKYIIQPKYQQKFYPIFFFYEFLQISGPNFYEEIRFNYPEVKNYGLFKENQKISENNDEICSLIRNDSIEEFVSIVNQRNLSLFTQIEPSIFETNLFLIDKKPTLIEYASFFGSIQIFKYLLNTKVKLTPSLWPFAIHSQNSELIQILEENNIKPENNSFVPSLIESIKCHYLDITQYILDNHLSNDNEKEEKDGQLNGEINENEEEGEEEEESNNYDDGFNVHKSDPLSIIYKYHDYMMLSDELEGLSKNMHDFCKYDYLYIVKFLMDSNDKKIKPKKVFNILFK